LIEVKNLVKKYGDHTAVNDISFTVEKGKIYGFLGPNGAGKSTTMNIITGYISATSGQALIDGHDIFDEPREAKKLIGYLPEQPPLYPDMTVYEYLKFVAELKEVPKDQQYKHIGYAMKKTGIVEMSQRLIKHLSKGYKQRVGLAQALIGNPPVIILDEPTVGLDPMQIIEIRDLIKSLRNKHTVILSSHILSEVSAVCDHVLIVSKGKLVASDTPENLSRLMRAENNFNLIVKGSTDDVKRVLSEIEGVTRLDIFRGDDGTSKVILSTPTEIDPREKIAFLLAQAGLPLLGMEMTVVSLEDVFIKLTSGGQSDDSEDKNSEAGNKKRKEKK